MKKNIIYLLSIIFTLVLILYFMRGERPNFDSFRIEELGKFSDLTKEENSTIRDIRKVSGSSEINFLGDKQEIIMKRIKSSDGQINLSIPSHWEIKDDSSKALFCKIGEKKGNNFKIFIHNKKETIGLTIETYRDYFLNLVSEDTVKKFTIKEFSKAVNTMEEIYFLNTASVDKGVKYETFTIILENDNYIFDFTYWTSDNKNEFISKFLFFYVMYTIDICGYYVLPQPVELREAEIIWE
ncbi:MAG: hypothetical protein R8P61_32720 [Bacteroidia bacterium]|nr:hypothetical protein [Bacteroidia bacterium]